MYEIRETKSYRKAYKKLSKNKYFDGILLDKIINTLAEGGKLSSKYLDHQLSGELNDFRECHVKNDMLLVYQKHNDALIIVLIDIGSHSFIF